MKNVYFIPIGSYQETGEINRASVDVLGRIIQDEPITLEKFVPLKVHFGEAGNRTYIEAKNFRGIIAFLKEQSVESGYIETNVLYGGERKTRTLHLKTAKDHGFDDLPVIIADGEYGEDFEEVPVNQKHFKTCKIAKGIAELKQMIVLSHFKGHILAGFGGAVKQLAMGCASKGGKLAQHANAIPTISYFKCTSCKACAAKCPASAINIKPKAKIDKEKCIGCASCIGVCPHGAISNSWMASLTKSFAERLAESALAASRGKKHIYITYALNITKGCDCEGHIMQPIVSDIGVLASTDPVALDQACLDILDQQAGKTVFSKGRHILAYGEKIGLGNRSYNLVTLEKQS